MKNTVARRGDTSPSQTRTAFYWKASAARTVLPNSAVATRNRWSKDVLEADVRGAYSENLYGLIYGGQR